MLRLLTILFACFLSSVSFAQNSIIRGFVYDKINGNPLVGVVVKVQNHTMGGITDEKGFYTINDIPAGNYVLMTTTIGYDTVYSQVKVGDGGIYTEVIYLESKTRNLTGVHITAEKQRKEKEVNISQVNIRPRDLITIPAVGGEPDLVQYLQVLPGVVFSGDQGGQLYIRGGSPMMNRVMLDGLTVYNPFHSIGLFSIFDSDILQTAEVYSAGFSAEYGGRISAIVDVKTRDGNHTDVRGKLNASPFNAKLLIEGPLKKYELGKSRSSYIISYKNSYLDKTSPYLYNYVDQGSLPYSFSDLYGKLSFKSDQGSYLKLFGFDFKDRVNFEGLTSYAWDAVGVGGEFQLVPGTSRSIIDGTVNYSDYYITQTEKDARPRTSGIQGYNVRLNFNNNLRLADKLVYGLEMNAFRTDFEIYNALNRRISQFENTTEISAFFNYLKNFNKKFLLEVGARVIRYASLSENTLEPRIRAKYNKSSRLRFKSSAGIYSQNLMSAVSDRDVVNLFYGFLSGPENLQREFDGKPVTSRLQKSQHGVFGFELDLTKEWELNAEAYIKNFSQITNINRDKIFDNTAENNHRPDYLKQDYIIERGQAYGFDVSGKFDTEKTYLWLVYSFNIVNRYDGVRKYQPHFDRRHNINLVSSYNFGEDESWSANLRWNFGSGFPFTLTQGFYELLDFSDGANTDYTSANGDLGILYDDLNQGRLPYYHRLDASIKKVWKLKSKKVAHKTNEFSAIFSVTNIYNRNNIFYFDRVAYQRVNQLPVLPTVSVSYSF